MEDMIDGCYGALNSPEGAINSPKEVRVAANTNGKL